MISGIFLSPPTTAVQSSKLSGTKRTVDVHVEIGNDTRRKQRYESVEGAVHREEARVVDIDTIDLLGTGPTEGKGDSSFDQLAFDSDAPRRRERFRVSKALDRVGTG